MILSSTELSKNLNSILDQIIDTGIPVEIAHNGHNIKITLADGPSKLERLKYRPDVINGDPDSLVQSPLLGYLPPFK